MSVTRCALIAVCCQISMRLSSAAVVSDDHNECAALPQDETPAGERVMLQHAESHRVVNAHRQETTSSVRSSTPPQCNCEKIHPTWKPINRTTPKCVFVDLGAADGNSFNAFLTNAYGDVSSYTANANAWEAILVEANPLFDKPLVDVASQHPGSVSTLISTAAYMCEAQTTFYLDTVNVQKDFWGSSMAANHPDVTKGGGQNVTVPTVNIIKLIYENTIPDDNVILKMDIEGAEYDILPCLALSPVANLVDSLYLEIHAPEWGFKGNTMVDLENAQTMLRNKNVSIPEYLSPTLLQKGSRMSK